MKRIITYIVYLFCLSLIINGCVSIRAPRTSQQRFTPKNAIVRQTQLAKLQNWNINGAFSIAYPQHDPIIAAYRWQQIAPDQFNIRISSSLDIYNAEISKRGNIVILRKSATESYHARSVEGLMQRILGWTLPISNMYYWARGIPAPGSKIANYDAYGHLIFLQQQGWTIQYKFYETMKGIDLPRIIYMNHGDYQIKIVIKRWNF